MKSSIATRRLAARVFCASTLVLAAVPATCQVAAAAKPDAQQQAQARAIMMKMAQFLAAAQRFRVDLQAGYDSVQASGQKIEFHENRSVTLMRPDRLRIEGTRSDGTRLLTVFTGKEVVVQDYGSKVYARTPQPGPLDDAIVYFVRDLGMRLPLAAMLLGRLPAELQERIQSVDYVELGKIDGVPAHHIAARGETVDVQLWVADGAQPLPQRIVLTYKKEPGQPQFRADFSKWNLAPEINAATFTAQVPEGLQKVAFAAQLPRAGRAAPKEAPQKGGK